MGTVVLALLDPEVALHRQAVHAVRRQRADRAWFTLPANVLAELLVGAARIGEAGSRRVDDRRSQSSGSGAGE